MLGFALRFDDFADEGECVEVESVDRGAVERFTAQEDRFAESQMIDSSDGVRRRDPVEIGRIATRHDGERVAGEGFDRFRER